MKLICNDYVSHAASFAFARKPPAFHLVMQIDPSSQVASGLKEVRMQYHTCQQMGWAGWKLCPCGKLRNPDQFPFIHVSGRIKPFAETLSELNFLNCSPILLRNAITLWFQKWQKVFIHFLLLRFDSFRFAGTSAIPIRNALKLGPT